MVVQFALKKFGAGIDHITGVKFIKKSSAIQKDLCFVS